MTWETESNPATEKQIAFIEEMCDNLNIDYEQNAPDSFEDAIDIIEGLLENYDSDDSSIRIPYRDGYRPQ